MLLLELYRVVSGADSQLAWWYVFAPITGFAIPATFNGELVWSADRRCLRYAMTEAFASDVLAN